MSLRIRNWKDHFENNRTKDLKKTAWVPVPNRMDDLGYIRLVTHPNGASHLGAWIAILEIVSRCDPRGTFPHQGAEIPQALAEISRLPATVFEEVLPRLSQLQWIEYVGEIPQEGAEIPQEGAPRAHAEGNGREQKGTEGNGTETPKTPASGETLFDEQTSTNPPSVVRPDVPPAPQKRKNGSGRPMSSEQREWLTEFLALHPRNTSQVVSATKLWAERVKEKPCFEWLMAQLKRECAGDTTYLHGPGKWLADHLELYAAGITPVAPNGKPAKSEETPTFYKGEFMSHAEYAARKAAGQ